MKHKEYKADLTGWNLVAVRNLEELGLKAAGEALQYIFESDETYIYFPIEWDFGENGGDGIGGRPPTDPMTMYLRVGMESGGEKPTFEFSLSDVVDKFIDLVAADGKIGDLHLDSAKAVSAGLKILAKRIDDACG